MLADYSKLIFSEFETKLSALMKENDTKVFCGLKFPVEDQTIPEDYWWDPRFLRMVSKLVLGDEHIDAGNTNEK